MHSQLQPLWQHLPWQDAEVPRHPPQQQQVPLLKQQRLPPMRYPGRKIYGSDTRGGIAVGSSDGEAVKGGTLVVSMPSSPRTLDPKAYSTMYENHIMYNVLDTCLSGIRITKM